MWIPDKMKLNKFEAVKIPSNSDYFARLGKMELGDDAYSGDDPVAMPGSKMDAIIAGEFAVERELRDAAEAKEREAAAAAAAKAAEKKDDPKNDEK